MNGEMLPFQAADLVERLLLASVDVALLGAVVWAFLRLCKRCPPRLAAMLWLLVLAKPLLTLAVGPSVSLLSIPLPSWASASVETPSPPPTRSTVDPLLAAPPPANDLPATVVEYRTERASEPSATGPLYAPRSLDLAESPKQPTPTTLPAVPSVAERTSHVAEPSVPSAVSNKPIVPTPDPSPGRPRQLSPSPTWPYSVITLLWMAGLTWGVAVAAVRFLLLRHRIAVCQTAGGRLGQMYATVLAEMGHRGRPARLLVDDSFKSPALTGCLRPVIVLPEWFVEQADATQIRWAIKHEVTHLLHGDHWGDLFRRVVRTLLFFHPVVRLAARRWEEAVEEACDRALVGGEKDVVDYTTCLLSIVERVGPSRPQPAPLGLFATQTQLQRRISRLLGLKSGDFAPPGRHHRWLLLPGVLMMLCGFSLARQPREEPTEPSSDPAVEIPADEPAKATSEPTSSSVVEILTAALADAADAAEASSRRVKSSLDPRTAEVLTKTLEANRYWFEGPPRKTPGYRYTFVHRDGKRQPFSVANPREAGAWVKRGITYEPLAAVLLSAIVDPDSKAASITALEQTEDEILLKFQTDGTLGSRLGGGVSGSWSGFIYYKLGSGTLRLDAKTLMPIELTSTFHDDARDRETTVTERLGEPFEVDPGHWVPLSVEAVRHEKEYKDDQVEDENTYRFDWAFRVYKPGLWLFDAEPIAEGTATGYHLEDVVIGDVEKPPALASSSRLEAIHAAQRQAKKIVDEYVEANRAWLAPDLKKRRGLVYDYAQEDGYRERIIFDAEGNILAQLDSDRQSNEHPSSGRQRLFTADGREASGTVDEPFLTSKAFDPNSTSPFSGAKMLHNLTTGWGWECASMRLARAADDFGVELRESADGNTRTFILRPARNNPRLHIGTMLQFTSWAYLPSRPFARCEVEIDAESNRPVQEQYFREGEDEPFCTIRFTDWFDTPEGKAPGQVIGRATYTKRGERDPETREYATIDEVFHFTGKYRLIDAGFLLLDEVVSAFESTGSGSTGRVTLVDPTDEAQAPIQDALARLDATAEFLAQVEQAPRGRTATVPCRWGETIPVWLNGKYENAVSVQPEILERPPVPYGRSVRKLPMIAYQKNLGIQDVRPERLDDGKLRVTVNVYSTIYLQGHAFDLQIQLLDASGSVLAEQATSDLTHTMSQPELKPIVFELPDSVDSNAVTSISVSLKIKRQTGGHMGSQWFTLMPSWGDSREIDYLPGARPWGPEQAVGQPTNSRSGGDYKSAWSSLTEDGQEEWLELTYRNRVKTVGVNVYETFNPGAVHKITYYDLQGAEQIAWQGKDPTVSGVQTTVGVSKIRFDAAVVTDRVRIYLDSPRVKGWNEIDAVGLVEAATGGLPEREHWALDAKASSTFADEPCPESITYQYDGPHTELKHDDGYRDWMRSLGGGHWQVVRFTRPENTPYLDAARVLASSYGSRTRNATFYILDEEMNVLLEQTSESRIRERGQMKWYVFHAPAVEVPETFHIAFQLFSQQYGGVYVGTRQLPEGESGASFTYDKQQGLKPLEVHGVGYDWMIRAYLAAKPDEEARAAEAARKQREADRAAISSKGPGWGPKQATGRADAYKNESGGDYQSAWASKTQDGQAEWLDLTYGQRVKAIGVDIYETFNPGAVNRVTVFDSDGAETTAWQGTDPTPIGIAGGKGISRIRFDQPVETDHIRIYLDSVQVPGWNEIDAVGLVESELAIYWAVSAKASSTYAE